MKLIRISNLTKIYSNKNQNEKIAIFNCNLEINAGSFVVITGSTGSGKSTLLHLLGGYDRPTSGSIYMNNESIDRLSDNELARLYQKEVGLILKDHQLIPELTIYENIIMPSVIRGCKIEEDYLDFMIGSLHMREALYQYPKQITDEMKQSARIVRALVNHPKLILADDPMKDMNLPLCYEVLELLLQYHHTNKCTLVLTTRKPELSIFANHMIHMENGRIVEDRIKQIKSVDYV